ncbi:MAG: GNAT family N-acetyltransferase [Maritimibacter sp.]
MEATEYARIYEAAFVGGRGWSADEIARLISAPGGFVVHTDHGFAIGRSIAGEAEVLTLAVDPSKQRRGQGRRLLGLFEAAAQNAGARDLFLEVAADNAPARGLYTSHGWRDVGRRSGYYARPDGAVDAVLMGKVLP